MPAPSQNPRGSDLGLPPGAIEALMESVPTAVLITRDGRIHAANDRCARLLCYERDGLIGARVARIFPGRSQFLAASRDSAAPLGRGESVHTTVELRRADGEALFVKAAGRAAHPEAPELGTIWVLQDISAERKETRELAASELRHRGFFERNRAVMLLIDPVTGGLIDANDAAAEFYGYAREELQRMRISDLNVLPLQSLREKMHAAVQRDGEIYFFRHRRKNGELRDVAAFATPVQLEGRVLLYSIIHDVTERRRAEENLKIVAAVFDNTVEGVWIADRDLQIMSVNRAFTDITGYSPEDVIGANPGLWSSGRQGNEFFRRMWSGLNREGRWSGEIWNRRKSGEAYPERLTITAVRDDEGAVTHYVGVFSDATRTREVEAQVSYMATHDPLTGLPNRALLHEKLNDVLERASIHNWNVALFMLDLDRFKILNESAGHQAGDAALREAGERVLQIVRRRDHAARFGGDEFALILEDCGPTESVASRAAQLLQSLARPFEFEGREYFLSASVGVSLYPHDGEDWQQMVKNAGAAMSRAKDQGRNNYQFYTAEMQASAVERLELEADLRYVLAREELELYYQPIIDYAERRIHAFEALLRWKNGLRGFVSPARFIPIAEESGLIIPIGEWVFATAAAQLREWKDAGLPPVKLSVNLSARQLLHAGLIASMRDILQRTGAPPDRLILEVTESAAMEDAEACREALLELTRLGMQLSLDDFGTGYSSLSYLKRLPIRTLKIDKSFLAEAPGNPESEAIVRAIVALARSLGLQIVQEGVENEAQIAFLKEQRVGRMQGFYFSRPLPAAEAAEFLQRGLTERMFLV